MKTSVKLKKKSFFPSKNMDLTTGPIFKTLVLFSIPIILTSLLNHLYSTIDSLMLALMVSDKAVGAVGATHSIQLVITSLFSGLAVGASIVMGKYVGAKDKENATRTVSTSILLGVIGGAAVLLIALFFSRPLLVLTGTPKALLEDSISYLIIVCMGCPITLTTGFIGGILRASGDTRSPFIHNSIGGLLNVLLNALFIAVFKMQVAGVAIATVISQAFVLVLQVSKVVKEREIYHLTRKGFKLFKEQLVKIAIFGIPSGINSMLTGFSHVVVQGAVNTFGEIGATASSIANQIDYITVFSGGLISAATVFFSQNLGAKKIDRFKKVLKITTLSCTVLTIGLSSLFILFSNNLLGIFTNDDKVIEFAKVKVLMLFSSYFVLEIHNVFASAVRVLGKPVTSMVVAMVCSVLFKVLWLLTVFNLLPTPYMLYACYPISRVIYAITIIPIYFKVLRKKQKKLNQEKIVEDNKIEKVA